MQGQSALCRARCNLCEQRHIRDRSPRKDRPECAVRYSPGPLMQLAARRSRKFGRLPTASILPSEDSLRQRPRIVNPSSVGNEPLDKCSSASGLSSKHRSLLWSDRRLDGLVEYCAVLEEIPSLVPSPADLLLYCTSHRLIRSSISPQGARHARVNSSRSYTPGVSLCRTVQGALLTIRRYCGISTVPAAERVHSRCRIRIHHASNEMLRWR